MGSLSGLPVSNLIQEYMASRPIVPQNHNDMADSLFFIPWYIQVHLNKSEYGGMPIS